MTDHTCGRASAAWSIFDASRCMGCAARALTEGTGQTVEKLASAMTERRATNRITFDGRPPDEDMLARARQAAALAADLDDATRW